jgi:hypothetical protein
MKKALIISLAQAITVWIIDRAIAYFILKEFETYKSITAVELIGLLSKKYYLFSAVNVVLSISLYFILRKFTETTNFTKFILCISAFILNVVVVRYF